jgi:hypothetical protein
MKGTRRGPFPSGRLASRLRHAHTHRAGLSSEAVRFLQNSGFQVSLTQEGEVQVPGGDAHLLTPALAVWNELHKDARAEIVQSQANP